MPTPIQHDGSTSKDAARKLMISGDHRLAIRHVARRFAQHAWTPKAERRTHGGPSLRDLANGHCFG
jgi:hypothetical protein